MQPGLFFSRAACPALRSTIARMKPAVLAALLALGGLAPTGPAAVPWVRVETPNFVVYGDAGERRVREVAEEFERFREALGRVIPGTGTTAAVPTVVVLFRSDRAFEPYRPRYNDKPVALGGYFLSSDDMNIVALVDGERDEALRRIFHEYVHLAISNVLHGLPLWLNEGLAEFYSTFRVQDNGRRALVGGLIHPHLQLLNQRTLLSIDELLSVAEQSPEYNEGERRSLFYAQSWALVHMLASGTPNRAADLGRYANLTSGGVPSRDAWRQVFGEENLIRALDRYVGQRVMKGVLYQFDTVLPTVSAAASSVSPADAEAALADLLRRVATRDEATAALERATSMEPVSSRARALYGLHALDHDEYEKARRLLIAAAESPDWLVQYHVATGLTRLLTATAGTDPEPAVLDAVRHALARVRSARPDLPHALAMTARIEASSGTDLARALDTIRRARTLAPGRADYALTESFILVRRGEYTASRELLTPLTASSFSPSIRNAAQRLMAEIAELDRSMNDYIAGLEGRRTHRASEATSRARAAPVTTFRTVREGERRVEGMLERIECSSDAIVLEVRTEDRLERFRSPATGIEFISYRPELAGAISCGPRTPPDRIYLTWRADEPSRRIVAVEFLQ
jgi:tetratricopeptide (TPR) repeat protein